MHSNGFESNGIKRVWTKQEVNFKAVTQTCGWRGWFFDAAKKVVLIWAQRDGHEMEEEEEEMCSATTVRKPLLPI